MVNYKYINQDECVYYCLVCLQPASARGVGVRVVSKWSEIPKRRSVIVQHYIALPYLINSSKFDLRIYVYVTCYDPLRVYVYDNGLARFASVKYVPVSVSFSCSALQFIRKIWSFLSTVNSFSIMLVISRILYGIVGHRPTD